MFNPKISYSLARVCGWIKKNTHKLAIIMFITLLVMLLVDSIPVVHAAEETSMDFLIKKIKVPQGYEIQRVYKPEIVAPFDVAIHNKNIFFIEESSNKIRKISPNGTLSIYVTLDVSGLSSTLAVNQAGDIFVAEGDHILKISTDRKVTTLATGIGKGMEDSTVHMLAVGPSNHIYAAVPGSGSDPSFSESRIYKISPTGEVSILTAEVFGAYDMEFSPAGELYVTELGTGSIVKVDSNGKVNKFFSGLFRTENLRIAFGEDGYLYHLYFGTGLLKISPEDGSHTYWEDIRWLLPLGDRGDFVFDSSGNLIVPGCTRNFVARISPDTGKTNLLVKGSLISALAADPNGNIFAGDMASSPVLPGRVVKVGENGDISEFVTDFENVLALTFDNQENLYVSTTGEIYKVSPSKEVNTFFTKTGEFAMEIVSMAFNPKTDELYGLDLQTRKVLKIATGKAEPLPVDFGGVLEDGGIAFDEDGNLYVLFLYEGKPGEPRKRRVYKITPDNKLVEFYNLDTKYAAANPRITTGLSGNIYLIIGSYPKAPSTSILKISPEGKMSVLAENVQVTHDPLALTVDQKGDVFFSGSTGIYKIVKPEETPASTPPSIVTPSPMPASGIAPIIAVGVILVAIIILGTLWFFKGKVKPSK